MKKLLLTAVMVMSANFANAGSLTEKYEREEFLDTVTSMYMVAESCNDLNSQRLLLKSMEDIYQRATTGRGDPFNIKGTDILWEWNLSIIRSVANPTVREFNQLSMRQGSKKSLDFITACDEIRKETEYFYDTASIK